MSDGETTHSNALTDVYTSAEVADKLNVSHDAVERLSLRFPQVLSTQRNGGPPSYSTSDIAVLVAVQQLLAQGYSDDQIGDFLTTTPAQEPDDNRHDQEPALTSASEPEAELRHPSPAAARKGRQRCALGPVGQVTVSTCARWSRAPA